MAEQFRCTYVIAAYNAASFIEETIASALAQDPCSPPPIIVVDDGSKDATPEIVSAIPGVQLVRQENAGPSAARNRGLSLVETPFVTFLDADDLLEPDASATHLAVMDEHPKAVMVFGANYRIDSKGQRIDAAEAHYHVTNDPEFIAMNVTPCGSQAMLRTEAVREVGGYDEDLWGAEDIDLYLRLAALGEIVRHPAYVMSYRIHDGQATRKPAEICRQHLSVLKTRLGPQGHGLTRKALKRVLHRWSEYYGQFIPIEIVRALLSTDFKRAASAGQVFVSGLPASAVGAFRFARKKLFPR